MRAEAEATCREVDAISVGTCCGVEGSNLTDGGLINALLMLGISILSSCVSMVCPVSRRITQPLTSMLMLKYYICNCGTSRGIRVASQGATIADSLGSFRCTFYYCTVRMDGSIYKRNVRNLGVYYM